VAGHKNIVEEFDMGFHQKNVGTKNSSCFLYGLCPLWLWLALGCQAGESVDIQFQLTGSAGELRCGSDFVLGSSTTQLADLRFYIHAPELLDDQGLWHAVQFVDDGIWQEPNIALLDFEDASGRCINGSVQIRKQVELQTEIAEPTGFRFKVGVPFEKNHQDPALSTGPLAYGSMNWGWQAGYKFLRIDLNGQDDSYRFHLGSTGCQGTIGAITACERPNRPQIELSPFTPQTHVIKLDLPTLFAGSAIDQNSPDTAQGCMSNNDDPDCAPLFEQLGLNLTTGAVQDMAKIFTIELK
jgi:uncharacterized repeat protein (TIGR04052 family)